MSGPPAIPKPASIPTVDQTLRRLFLTLFLRGRSARGLKKETVPKSLGSKLAWTLLFYALVGSMALLFARQTVFSLSLYIHAMTLAFLGMFVAVSTGEVLFNKEEGDILLHRPIASKALLKAKISVMLLVSLWLAGAFNLVSLWVGFFARDASHGGWCYPAVHLCSASLEAIFCVSAVVLSYQLCLRWFGRERLDGLMTGAQVFVAVAAMLAGQIVPRLMARHSDHMAMVPEKWWLVFLPPAWFAGLDDALAGSGANASYQLAILGLVITGVIVWLAFVKLARNYGAGLQQLNEGTTIQAAQTGKTGRAWLQELVRIPPLNWFLRDSVSRASFVLISGYLLRDRDTKLRIYPGLAPMLVMPLIFLLQGNVKNGNSFGLAFGGSYLGLIPLMGINLLQYSQQWQAADTFRMAPLHGPAAICHGARWAVLVFLTLPCLFIFAVLAAVLGHAQDQQLLLLLPGIIALPIYSLVPSLRGAIPLSAPVEAAKSANRGLTLIGVMIISGILSGIAWACWNYGYFSWFIITELLVVTLVYWRLNARLAAIPWPTLE